MTTTAESASQVSAWAPLRNKIYRYLFIAQLVSNIGLWMQTVGAPMVPGGARQQRHHRRARPDCESAADAVLGLARRWTRRSPRSQAPADRGQYLHRGGCGGHHIPGLDRCADACDAAGDDVPARMRFGTVGSGVAGHPARARSARTDPGSVVAGECHRERGTCGGSGDRRSGGGRGRAGRGVRDQCRVVPGDHRCAGVVAATRRRPRCGP